MDDNKIKNKARRISPETLDEMLRLSEADRMSPIPPKEVRHENGKREDGRDAVEKTTAPSDPEPAGTQPSDENAQPSSPEPESSAEKSKWEEEEKIRVQKRVEVRQSEVRRGITDTLGMKVSEYEKIVAGSDLLQSMKEYEETYIARRQKYERKCVLIDAVIFNTLDRVSFYRMCRANMINAILKFAIHEHRDELSRFLRKDDCLL